MVIDSFLFFIILFIYFLMMYLLVWFYLFYIRGKKESRDLPTFDTLEKSAEEMRNHAQDIIEQAVAKAEKMLLQTDFIKSEIVRQGEETIRQVAQNVVASMNKDKEEYEKEYKTLFDKLGQEFANRTDQVLKKIEELAERELSDFETILKRQTVGAQAFVGKKISEEFDKTQKEIEEYKVQKLKTIDKTISELIAKVVKDVVGKTLTVRDHEQLILEALERAKRENVFVDSQSASPQPINKTLMG